MVRRTIIVAFAVILILAVLPINPSSPTNTTGLQDGVEQSNNKSKPICGTPMYNDPQYLASKVTYHGTQSAFSATGKPMNIAPSNKASGAHFDQSISMKAASTMHSSRMNAPSPASFQRHIMCKDVDMAAPPWSPINPTTTFLPTDATAKLLMTFTADDNITSVWNYRNDDSDDAWDLYGGLTEDVPSPGTYYYWVSLTIAGNPDLPSYPRGWIIDVYLDNYYHFSEFFEITDDGWQSVTCENVDGAEPVNIKDTFTIGVDAQVYYYLRLYEVAYYNDITDHCHDYKII